MNNVSGLYKCQYPGCDTTLVLQNVTIGGNPVKKTKNFSVLFNIAAHESTIISIKLSI